MGFLSQGSKDQPWKSFVNHQKGQAQAYEKHEDLKNQMGSKKPWNEWLHDYTGVVAAPKTPAPPKPEIL